MACDTASEPVGLQTERAPQPPDERRQWPMLVAVAAVWCVLAVHAGWPAPDVNEPHYLSKARHFWQPDWASSDFFLGTPDAHQVFNATVGWVAAVLPLEYAAWLGRGATWLLQAWGWCRLARALRLPWLGVVLSAALFVAFNDRFHMAGEWVVGGFEAKPIAYALVWHALAWLAAGAWNRHWVLLGAASCMHVLVGGWSVVASGCAWCLSRGNRPTLLQMVSGLLLGGLLALPGLWPAVRLTADIEPETVTQANLLYVYERLPHHLLVESLPPLYTLRFSWLFCIWIALVAFTPAGDGLRRIRGYVWGACAISAGGLLLSLALRGMPEMAAALLRFYWFRLADMAVPMGVALEGLQWITLHWHSAPRRSRMLAAVCVAFASLHAGDYLLQRAGSSLPRADKPGRTLNYPDWLEACAWVREHSAPDARFITPRGSQTFLWYTGRGQVATLKDLPQDAPGIVEWQRRLEDLYATGSEFDPWFGTLAERDESIVRELAERYAADYVIAEVFPPLELPRVFANETYAVYAMSETALPRAGTAAATQAELEDAAP